MSVVQVALIRGINVGKAKRIAMAELRELCTNLGFKKVRTLLNSGNIVFTAKENSSKKSAGLIENAIFESFGISARVIVITAQELGEIIDKNPLVKMVMDPSRMLVTVLEKPSDAKNVKPFEKKVRKPEAMAIGRRAVYQWCPNGILKSEIAQAVANEFGDTATARNWATMLKLYHLVQES